MRFQAEGGRLTVRFQEQIVVRVRTIRKRRSGSRALPSGRRSTGCALLQRVGTVPCALWCNGAGVHVDQAGRCLVRSVGGVCLVCCRWRTSRHVRKRKSKRVGFVRSTDGVVCSDRYTPVTRRCVGWRRVGRGVGGARVGALGEKECGGRSTTPRDVGIAKRCVA